MTAFDTSEYARWAATARRQLRIARHSTDGGFHEAAVLHAEQSAQCSLKALLHAAGAGPAARGHSLVDLATSCERLTGLQLDSVERDALGELAATYQASRYPDALPGGTPAEHFGVGAAERAITAADALLARVAAHVERLTAAQAGEDG